MNTTTRFPITQPRHDAHVEEHRAEIAANNWRVLNDELEAVPTGTPCGLFGVAK